MNKPTIEQCVQTLKKYWRTQYGSCWSGVTLDDAMAIDTAFAALEKFGQGEAVPVGWTLVPVELTREMIDAANSARGWVETDTTSRGCYRAMLAAAPALPEEPQ